MRKKIQDKSLTYSLLRPTVRLAFRLFYPRLTIVGKERIPADKAIIYAPNHQNALIDPLVLLAARPQKRIVFLARADIFRKKAIARVLYFLRILPVYRIRDGKEELDKNYEIFNKSVDVLRDGIPLCLMAEGRQSFKRQLLPLVKGMFRIAFQAQEALPEKELVIVPVGIDYSNYVHPFANVIIQFGEPVDVGQYKEMYKEQPARALNLLRNDVADGLHSLIQDIRSEKHYYEFYGISRIDAASYCKEKGWKQTPFHLFQARQEISQNLDELEATRPEKAEALCQDYLQRYPQLKKHERKGLEFRSSVSFVIWLIVVLLGATALLIWLAVSLFL